MSRRAGQKRGEGAECLEGLGIDFIIVDDDAEPVFQIGEDRRDGHGIELGQGAEQGRSGIECRDARLGQAECLAQAGAQGLIGGDGLFVRVRTHDRRA